MEFKNMTKLIFCFGFVFFVFYTIFNSQWLVSKLPNQRYSQDDLSANSLIEKKFPTKKRTRKEVLQEMLSNGWLDKNYSEWFVSPEGNSTGSGKINSPMDLTTAFSGKNNRLLIKPGDIVWLRGGTYKGSFTVKIGGNSKRPIHFRQYPGERAILDKSSANRKVGTLNVRNSYLWFWDFEVSNSFSDRKRLDSDGKLKPWRGSGINVWAANTKYINLVVRDNGHGFGVWNEEGNTEIYGCLIFNNGNNKKEHGIYAHNKTGKHLIENNIIFNNAGYGLHIYANSSKRSISGFDIDKNILFENGSLMNEDQVADQILVGGVKGAPASRIKLRGNVVYTNPLAKSGQSRGIRLGYKHKENDDVTLQENLIVGKIPLKIFWWKSIKACRNRIISSGRNIEIKTPLNFNSSNYKFAQNSIISNGKKNKYFVLNGKKTSFDNWHSQINNGNCNQMFTSNVVNNNSLRVVINRNKYDKTIAFVTIYNSKKLKNASIDLSNFLENGKKFSVFDAQNYFGEPVLKDVYDGNPIRLPLLNNKITLPIGKTEQNPVHTGTEFSVFTVQKN